MKKTTLAILALLALAIGLGGGYAFMPKPVNDTDPDVDIRRRLQVDFQKEFPFVRSREVLSFTYLGQGRGRISGYSENELLALEPGVFLGCGFGLDSFPIHQGVTYSTPLPEPVASGKLVIRYFLENENPDEQGEIKEVLVQF